MKNARQHPPETKQEALRLIASGESRKAIARKLKIHSSTITQWIKEHNKSFEEVKKLNSIKPLKELIESLPSVENKRFALYLKDQYSERSAIEYCHTILNPQVGSQKHELISEEPVKPQGWKGLTDKKKQIYFGILSTHLNYVEQKTALNLIKFNELNGLNYAVRYARNILEEMKEQLTGRNFIRPLEMSLKTFNHIQGLRRSLKLNPLLCSCPNNRFPCRYLTEKGTPEVSECDNCNRLVPWCFMGDGDQLCSSCWNNNYLNQNLKKAVLKDQLGGNL